MQAKENTEHELVKICMAELCQKAGFTNCGNLVQRDLIFLCDSIESKTGVLISLSTIKRLLNGQFSRLPQIATLDAIAISSGYQNWQSFKSEKNRAAAPVIKQKEAKRKPITKNRFLVSAGLLLLIALSLFIIKWTKPGLRNIGKAKFSAVKVTGNDIPNTVIFNYNIDSVTADSFFIQQSWDKNRRVKIDRHSHTLTDIYYEPGYHVAKLIANDQIIKTFDISIPTDKWIFYGKEKIPKSLPKYIIADAPRNGSLKLTREELLNSKIDAQKEYEFYQVYFPSKIESSSDNFVLKFRLRVNELNNEACPYILNEIYCQKNFMYFTNTLKGCTSDLLAHFGENKLNGKTNDLSMFGINVKEWQDMELMVKDKNVSVSINGVKVFSSSYSQSCGLITGIGFTSNALCEIDFVDLKTLSGKTIYSNNFDH